MTIIEFRGDSSPAGILRHWERKTKSECSREILRCYNEIERLRARVAELEAQNQELVADRERLDWLSEADTLGGQPISKEVAITIRPGCCHMAVHALFGSQVDRCRGETLRQAIDSARGK